MDEITSVYILMGILGVIVVIIMYQVVRLNDIVHWLQFQISYRQHSPALLSREMQQWQSRVNQQIGSLNMASHITPLQPITSCGQSPGKCSCSHTSSKGSCLDGKGVPLALTKPNENGSRKEKLTTLYTQLDNRDRL